MPRRPRPSRFGALASLPWWVGLALAAASAAVLYASTDATFGATAGSAALSGVVGSAVGMAAAVLFFFGLAAAWAAWRRARPTTRSPSARPTTAAQAIDGMSSREFEALLGEAFKLQGYQISQADGNSGTGVGMTLRKDRETVLVHSRHWQAERVGAETLGGLQKAMSARGATGGFVVTAGRFSREAIASAQQANLRLIDGPVLLGMIVKARAAQPSRTAQPSCGTPADRAGGTRS